MTELDQVKKVVSETTLRVLRCERFLDFILANNPNIKLPSQKDILDINLKAAKEVTQLVPWAKWVSEDE